MGYVIDYVELSVDDLAAAKDFYASALGWEFNDYGPGYAGIRDPRRAGEEFGGLSVHESTPAPRGGNVLALMRTHDADAAVAAVVAAGGRIQAPLEPYPGGRRFTFADPSGNVLGIYEPAETSA